MRERADRQGRKMNNLRGESFSGANIRARQRFKILIDLVRPRTGKTPAGSFLSSEMDDHFRPLRMITAPSSNYNFSDTAYHIISFDQKNPLCTWEEELWNVT